MILFQSLNFSELREDKKSLYNSLLYPIKNLFDEDLKRIFALAAIQEKTPIGLIVARIYPYSKEAHLVSFFVSPSFRGKGIGKQLMQKLLERLTPSISLFELKYKESEENLLALEKILKKSGWHPSTTLTERYFFDQYSFHPKWFFSPFPTLSESFTIFDWADAKETDIETAKALERNIPPLAQYSPFDTQYSFERLNSLGLRHLNQLIGWMITHRTSPNTIRYSAFYLLPEYRGSGAALCLLKESIRRHLSNEITTVGMMEINLRFSSPDWIKFIQKRLAPFAFRRENVKLAHFLLSDFTA